MTNVRINEAGLKRATRGPQMQRALLAAGETVAEIVRSEGIRVEGDNPGEIDLPVEVFDLNNAEVGAAVVINHPSGLAVQSKHGSLTKAAAQAGLRVTGGSR